MTCVADTDPVAFLCEMKRRLLVLAVLACPACNGSSSSVMVADDDIEMNAAIQKARARVATFVIRLERPEPTDRHFSVKVVIRDGEHVEHFWLDSVRYDKGVFYGTLGNVPQLVRGHSYGERVSVAAAEITDWMYVAGDHLVGGITIRAIRKNMSPAERAEMEKGLDFEIE